MASLPALQPWRAVVLGAPEGTSPYRLQPSLAMLEENPKAKDWRRATRRVPAGLTGKMSSWSEGQRSCPLALLRVIGAVSLANGIILLRSLWTCTCSLVGSTAEGPVKWSTAQRPGRLLLPNVSQGLPQHPHSAPHVGGRTNPGIISWALICIDDGKPPVRVTTA